MNTDFPRILTLLRKEKGISQKQAAGELGISQALLSHYEKGIRECGLNFLVRAADFYGVSCDYLLGRSPDRTGTQLTVEDIPDPDALGRENTIHKGSILPVLNKKLIANSMNILYDLLAKSQSKGLVSEVSNFLMLSVYRMFRLLYSANPRNQEGMFTIPEEMVAPFATAAMQICEARAACIVRGDVPSEEIDDVELLYLTTEKLSEQYPLFASSLLNVIQNCEGKMDWQPTKAKEKKK